MVTYRFEDCHNCAADRRQLVCCYYFGIPSRKIKMDYQQCIYELMIKKNDLLRGYYNSFPLDLYHYLMAEQPLVAPMAFH